MGTISRPPKGGAATTYAGAVAAGFTDIIDSDLDGDFTTIYNEFNGHITDPNIGAAAGIQYSKLALSGHITNTDIHPNSLNAHQVLVPASITQAEIGPLAVDTPQMQLLSATPSNLNNLVTTGTVGSVEQLISEGTWAGRGGLVLAQGCINGSVAVASPQNVFTVLRLRYGGTPGLPDGTPIDTQTVQAAPNPGTAGLFPVSITAFGLVSFLTGANARLKLTIQCTTPSVLNINSGRMILIEFA